jgi:hypothetical protein
MGNPAVEPEVCIPSTHGQCDPKLIVLGVVVKFLEIEIIDHGLEGSILVGHNRKGRKSECWTNTLINEEREKRKLPAHLFPL